ncbi:TetR/AcrR family transcriptional regulator [Janthinobacterium agaricidamnosum]|nr:TetR/AcrR family transcriptional regulator [Janthinobacterium agaricidamnosum]
MARPREFDRTEVLQKAVGVFWEKGYAATSTGDLLGAMNIGRQSMYDTFGDKRALYLEALQYYISDSIGGQLRNLQSGLPLEAVSNMLLAFTAWDETQRGLGCMGVNALGEFGCNDPDIAQIQQTGTRLLLDALETKLGEAAARGDIAAGVDIRAAARFIMSTLIGMKISARGGASDDELRSIARFAVNSLKVA